jgi:hypothetical protein
VGVLTNYDAVYWGDPSFDPIMELLAKYPKIPVQIHPQTPGCQSAGFGYSDGFSEYQFETHRAAENLLLKGRRKMWPDISFILVQAGGTIPYNGPITAGVANFLYGLNITETLAEFQNYFFDLSSSTDIYHLAALTKWAGVGKILIGTDCEYISFLHIVEAMKANSSRAL